MSAIISGAFHCLSLDYRPGFCDVVDVRIEGRLQICVLTEHVLLQLGCCRLLC